ncbi:MAG: TRCF domain-containing protein, partial [Pseudomonadota bacterium]|nr:TRCF domain-containing protein [Pseudomonadota bacterium]
LQIELIDRFGLLPAAAKNHIRLAELKNRAVQLGIDKIDASNKGGYLNFGEETRTDPAALISLVQNQGNIYRLRGAHRLQFGLDLSDVENRFLFMEELLDKLALPEIQSVEEAS